MLREEKNPEAGKGIYSKEQSFPSFELPYHLNPVISIQINGNWDPFQPVRYMLRKSQRETRKKKNEGSASISLFKIPSKRTEICLINILFYVSFVFFFFFRLCKSKIDWTFPQSFSFLFYCLPSLLSKDGTIIKLLFKPSSKRTWGRETSISRQIPRSLQGKSIRILFLWMTVVPERKTTALKQTHCLPQ